MKRYLLLLLVVRLLTVMLGSADMEKITAGAPATEPTVTAEPAPSARDKTGVADALERIGSEYDPALAGAVGALRWAGKLLEGYAADGQDPAAAESAAGEYIAANPDAAALETKLLRLRLAALQIASGEDLGLVREPGRRQSVDWTARDVEDLFEALFRGAGLPLDDLK